MLAHYITGKAGDNTVELVVTTVDTRETLIQNGTVDAVFATYTITPARAKKVAFAGPYYNSGAAIMVKADDDDIKSVKDLDGKTVATEANSTALTALQKFAPRRHGQLLFHGGRAVRGRRAAGPGRGLRARPGDPDLRREQRTRRSRWWGSRSPRSRYGIGVPLTTRRRSSSSTTG